MQSNSTNRSEDSGLDRYETRLDPEIRDFVARTVAWYPPETSALPIERQRAVYNAMCRAFHCGTPEGVVSTDAAIACAGRELRIRRYRSPGAQPTAAILYHHGGGFVFGDLDSHDDVCGALCGATGHEVISVDYRLAPEHRHPAAFDDACALFDWAAERVALPLLLAGESAGGNLAACVAHARRGSPRAAIGQVLIYPSLGSRMEGRSYREHPQAPMLTLGDLVRYRDARAPGGGAAPGDASLAPLDDADFSRLPPTYIITAECDPLSSDGELYRDRILAAGGRAAWHEAQGLVHSFMRARRTSARARQAFGRIAAAARSLGDGKWPY